jgi:hypothetical protein
MADEKCWQDMTDDERWQVFLDRVKQRQREAYVDEVASDAIRHACANCLKPLSREPTEEEKRDPDREPGLVPLVRQAWMLLPLFDHPEYYVPLVCEQCMRPDPQRTRRYPRS